MSILSKMTLLVLKQACRIQRTAFDRPFCWESACKIEPVAADWNLFLLIAPLSEL